MSTSPHDDGEYDSPAEPRRRTRAKVVAGIAGLAVLGGGAFLVTDQLTGEPATVGTGLGAQAPILPPEEPPAASAEPTSPAPSPTSKAATKAATKAPESPAPADTRSAEERVKAARAAAAKAGHPVQRALTPEPGAVAAAGPVEVTNEGSLKDGGTMRVISAKFDLAGQRELLWAADDGKPVGTSRCTQNFHFSNDGTAKERPTMLLCWRTSAARSVATVAVVATGRPNAANSVSVLDRRWAELG